MICLFTDFSTRGFYAGQMRGAVLENNPRAQVLDLFHDATPWDVENAARLLARLLNHTPMNAVIIGVVDPGVGGPRRPLMMRLDNRWLVGPDNGLFSLAARESNSVSCYEILWRPRQMSATFHGRDLFAPVAAMLLLFLCQ